MIYLDYQATTPVAPEVAAAMEPWITEKFANPHSPSRWGRERYSHPGTHDPGRNLTSVANGETVKTLSATRGIDT